MKKLANKAETIAALGGSALLALFVSFPLGVMTAGAWSIWRGVRWYNKKRDEAAKNRGYKNYQDYLNKTE